MKETKEELIRMRAAMPAPSDFICRNCCLWDEADLDEDGKYFCVMTHRWMTPSDTCDECMVNGCERLDLLMMDDRIAEYDEN